MCPEGTPSVETSKNNFDRYRRAANISLGVTAGLGLASFVLGIVTFSRTRREASATQRARVGLDPGGLRVQF